jgi:hypothetical protein
MWLIGEILSRAPGLIINDFHSLFFDVFGTVPFFGPISSLQAGQYNLKPIGTFYSEFIGIIKQENLILLNNSLTRLFFQYQSKISATVKAVAGKVSNLDSERYSLGYLASLFLLDPTLFPGIFL